ncbi:MAG: hypothetical protein EXR45_00410 [Chloroflexi bacterium]|nr:hypothetical protein [Chloroflexota bacterium]
MRFVHGNAHFFNMDTPLMSNGADRDLRESTGTIPQNFTRVMTFGSAAVHWLKVESAPSSRSLSKISPMMVPGNQTGAPQRQCTTDRTPWIKRAPIP